MIKLVNIVKTILTEQFNKWGGLVVSDKNNGTATISIWKLPGIWTHNKETNKYFFDKRDGFRYKARIDVTGPKAATIYIGVKDNGPEGMRFGSGYRDAKSVAELYPVIKEKLHSLGFSSDGIQNLKPKLSLHSWGDDIENYVSQPEYNADDHLSQSQFQQKMQKLAGDVQYRLNNPDEFDDK